MTINAINGFNPNALQPILIKSKDAKKYNITWEDWNKCDTNKDNEISSAEFISAGMGIMSITKAFQALAGENYKPKAKNKEFTDKNQLDNFYKTGVGVEKPNKSFIENGSNKSAVSSNSNPNQVYGLNHPNVANDTLALNLDLLV